MSMNTSQNIILDQNNQNSSKNEKKLKLTPIRTLHSRKKSIIMINYTNYIKT